MDVNNFKRLLISIPKCIEFKTKLILGLVPHPGPRQIKQIFKVPYVNFDLCEIFAYTLKLKIAKK